MTAFEQLCARLGIAQNTGEAAEISALVNELIFCDVKYSDEEIIEAVASYVRRSIRNECNQGYKIIAAETYATSEIGKQYRIVLGRMETKHGTVFVTWDSTTADDGATADYFWGHYFDNEKAARADYHRRLLEQYER